MIRIRHLIAAGSFAFLAGHAQAALFMDPQGDTFGVQPDQIDLKSINATYTATDLTFDLTFYDPIAPPSTAAPNSVIFLIDIDTDQNELTGEISSKSLLSSPSGLGIEYFLAATPLDTIEVIDTSTFTSVASAPIIFGVDSLSVTVSLADLGGDDGAVNYATVVGTIPEPTDAALDDQHPASSMPASAAVPEPNMAFTFLALLGSSFLRRRRD